MASDQDQHSEGHKNSPETQRQTNQRAMKDFVSLDDLNARIEGLKASDGAYKFLSSPISRYLATLVINQHLH